MNLEPITTRAVERPAYDNHRVLNFGGWLFDNLDALVAYWDELSRYAEPPYTLKDFLLFVRTQHDLQVLRYPQLPVLLQPQAG